MLGRSYELEETAVVLVENDIDLAGYRFYDDER